MGNLYRHPEMIPYALEAEKRYNEYSSALTPEHLYHKSFRVTRAMLEDHHYPLFVYGSIFLPHRGDPDGVASVLLALTSVGLLLNRASTMKGSGELADYSPYTFPDFDTYQTLSEEMTDGLHTHLCKIITDDFVPGAEDLMLVTQLLKNAPATSLSFAEDLLRLGAHRE